MKRPMSAFEQELATAMDEYAHGTEPPAFDPRRIATRERRRIRVRISLAAVGVATAAGIAACVATAGLPGTGHAGLPVIGQTTSPPSSATTAPTPSPSASSPGTATSTTPGSKPSAPGGIVPSWPTTPTNSPFAGSVPPVPVLTSIRTGAHPEGGYDRISLEFAGQLPGFKAEYVTAVLHEASGIPVSLPGAAYLQLTFTSAQAHDANGNPTLTPDPINPTPVNLPELQAYVLNGDFEGTISIALGLTAPDGFHVSELTKSPTDHVIYVDIARTG